MCHIMRQPLRTQNTAQLSGWLWDKVAQSSFNMFLTQMHHLENRPLLLNIFFFSHSQSALPHKQQAILLIYKIFDTAMTKRKKQIIIMLLLNLKC